ncbi:ACP S-malonyltransferase [Paenibacillus taichungensis]|uniref:ACP S-malonyltransferase n=1 Tax=Paenibacillus taichungensis TaxID=484184 RepID=UPI0038D17125
MATYVFPGQGAQFKGMGSELFREFKDMVREANAIVGYDIEELCMFDKHNLLSKTEYTQPALFVVNALSYLKNRQENNEKIDYFAGHSLGEYNALFAADVFDFETGVKLVEKRGQLMSMARGGGMSAVIGLDQNTIEQIISINKFNLEIANCNSPSQIVVSGLKEDVTAAREYFLEEGAKHYVILNVSGAFHSRHMQEYSRMFADYVGQFSFNKPSVPVISNVHAEPYSDHLIHQFLIEQMTNRVNWTGSIRYLLEQGQTEFVEVGPGQVLTKLIDAIQQTTTIEVTKSISTQKEVSEYTQTTLNKLGESSFQQVYDVKLSYMVSFLPKGITSAEMIIKLARSNILGFYGASGLPLDRIEQDLTYINKELGKLQPFGVGILGGAYNSNDQEILKLLLKHKVANLEIQGYKNITPALVQFRAEGLVRDDHGIVSINHRIIAQAKSIEDAEIFLSPAPAYLLEDMVLKGLLSQEKAEWLMNIPMVDDLYVESTITETNRMLDSAVLLPAVIKMRDLRTRSTSWPRTRIGSAMQIGSPETTGLSFFLGADFVVTRSINQATVEAGLSNMAKSMLDRARDKNSAIVPKVDCFESGEYTMVLHDNMYFAERADLLYRLFYNNDSWYEIDEEERNRIQELYLGQTFEQVQDNLSAILPKSILKRAERNGKVAMAHIYYWYLEQAQDLAITGDMRHSGEYHICFDQAAAACNNWLSGTEMETWENRRVDKLAEKLMLEAEMYLNERLSELKS